MKIIHESEVDEKKIPGRFIRWIADDKTMQPKYLSSCVIRVLPGETVQPAHAHTEGEELIYIMSGTGQAWVDGEIQPIRIGSAVLFEQGQVHMIRNVGDSEMKVVCFFAPPTGLDNYKFYEGVAFVQNDSFKR
jgi:mannose-6-phosphate isomerase-like protein (cupin superfamily)